MPKGSIFGTLWSEEAYRFLKWKKLKNAPIQTDFSQPETNQYTGLPRERMRSVVARQNAYIDTTGCYLIIREQHHIWVGQKDKNRYHTRLACDRPRNGFKYPSCWRYAALLDGFPTIKAAKLCAGTLERDWQRHITKEK